MKALLTAALLLLTMAMFGCAAPGQNGLTPVQQLQAWCPTATGEVRAFQSVRADLKPTAQTALDNLAPIVLTTCDPANLANANDATVQQWVQNILPQLTIIAVEAAAAKNQGATK